MTKSASARCYHGNGYVTRTINRYGCNSFKNTKHFLKCVFLFILKKVVDITLF